MGKSKRNCALFALALIFLTLSSCIDTYRPRISGSLVSYKPSKRHQPIHYFYSLRSKEGGIEVPGKFSIEWVVLYGVFDRVAQAVTAYSPPEKGIYVSVYKTPKLPSLAARACSLVNLITFSAFPCYSQTSGYYISYDIYIDKELKGSYQYDIVRQGVDWIAVLPFLWINVFTTSYADAFRVTAYQFIYDAEREGHF